MPAEPTDASREAPKILVVDDEPDIAALVAYQLTREGFRVETAANGSDALEAIGRAVPALLVLDRMLPDIPGDDVLRQIRGESATEGLPVLMLTARRERGDRIEGLELGADDYLTKPFSPRELVLRVRAILRRSREPAFDTGGRTLRAGGIRMDLDAHQVFVEDEEVQLTPTEFRLLEVLMEREGRTQSRQRLLEEAWELDAAVSGEIQTRTVDMHVRRLRAKLGERGAWVETIRGFGYRFRQGELDREDDGAAPERIEE